VSAPTAPSTLPLRHARYVEGVVNTYDPADQILYVHMAREPHP
jgi:hypothetical protein